MVIRRKQRKGTFCDRYGAALYDLKTPEGIATTICAGNTAYGKVRSRLKPLV